MGLFYSGLTVELCKPESHVPKAPIDFHVWRMTVTDKAWEVSPGVRVGMTRNEIEAVLGAPESVEAKSESEVLHYSPFQFDAWFWVTLKDGVVVEVGMAEDWS